MNAMAGCGGYRYVICINPYHKSYYGDVYINASICLDPIHYIILGGTVTLQEQNLHPQRTTVWVSSSKAIFPSFQSLPLLNRHTSLFFLEYYESVQIHLIFQCFQRSKSSIDFISFFIFFSEKIKSCSVNNGSKSRFLFD